jgi:hypothetical protein
MFMSVNLSVKCQCKQCPMVARMYKLSKLKQVSSIWDIAQCHYIVVNTIGFAIKMSVNLHLIITYNMFSYVMNPGRYYINIITAT